MSSKCNVCTKPAYPLESVTVEGTLFHKTCLRCAHCNGVLTLGKFAAISGKFYCKPHFKQLFALKGNYTEGFLQIQGDQAVTAPPSAVSSRRGTEEGASIGAAAASAMAMGALREDIPSAR